MLIGYMRVSTGEQSLDLQRDALERAGCERVYEDVARLSPLGFKHINMLGRAPRSAIRSCRRLIHSRPF
jgi:hypothetical protein